MLLAGLILLCAESVFAAKPNVLLLVADDLQAAALGVLGNREIRTPRLDRLAREGTVFANATCAYPLCVPSRAEMLTGCTSFRTGVGIRTTSLPKAQRTWPQTMRAAGYRTFHVGKWHVTGRPFERGFDEVAANYAGTAQQPPGYVDHRGRPATGYVGWVLQDDAGRMEPEKGIGLTPSISATFADAAIGLIERPHEHPFFIEVDFTAPHDPRLLPPGYEKAYDASKLSLPANFLPRHPFDHGVLHGRDESLLAFPRIKEELLAERVAYFAVVSHLDEQVGRVLDALDRRHLAENTLVIFTSDHGLALGSHGLVGKQNMYDHTLKVPLFFRGPGVPKGERRAALCVLRDLFPTVCEWCGVDVPQGLDGRSLAAAIRDGNVTPHEFVTGYFTDVQRAIRDDRWKYAWYPQAKVEQLFNIAADPDELRDLSRSAAHVSELARQRERLRTWLRSQGDPLVP